ncbi:hypothetical protein [Desulfobacter curvatus]|uniref:hypothetical protein n=1 Tax=Desulfobacter curvatus TaxID=2290 RepID=UPI0003768159|nr:hypothetical protein [Desulfobacter curvatus]
MRITDPQVIQDGEQDLIASVQKDLDLDAVKDLLKERLTASALSPKGGRIVVHDNDVAFRLDYEINLNGSLLFDRDGNLLEDSEGQAPQQDPPDEEDGDKALVSDRDDNLSIDLPDYDDALDKEHMKSQSDVLESEDLPDDIQDAEPGFEIEDIEDESEFDQDDADSIEAEAEDEDELIDDSPQEDDIEDLNVDELTDIGREDVDRETDEDISDLLKENRDFWENEKE